MKPQYILALDQGTTSSRAILFDKDANIIAKAQEEFRQIFPKSGWVEHDPNEIWTTQLGVIQEALAKASVHASGIAALGITNQRETTVVWNKLTGQPVYNSIVWQDRRTAQYCDSIREQHAQLIQEKTGLVLDAYFSASKLKWILDNVEGAKALAGAGELAFGTVDSWLIYQLSGRELHITDASNASRTMLYNIHTGSWDAELLDIFGIPESVLPEIKNSSEVYGHTAGGALERGIPIAGICGDQQAATFGQACLSRGMVKNTYGTGCFMLMQTEERAVPSKNKLLSTVAWQLGGERSYALEGSVFMAGAVVQWLRDGLEIIKSSSEVEALASSVENSCGLMLVPAFVGLGAPYWDSYARGTLIGLSRGSTKAHIARAALESIAFQSAELLQAMQKDSDIQLNELRVDGGASSNNLLMQFQADILGVPVVRPKVTETTALGAAYLAGLAVGYWQNTEEIAQQWKEERHFLPSMSQEERERLMQRWQNAVSRSRAWEDA